VAGSREQKIAAALTGLLGVVDPGLERAVELSKADLMSEMVYEFTELQGIMGEYYARHMNESEKVAIALREQYLPAGEDAPLPASPTGALLALTVKLDSLMALFSIGKIPTGTKDPFALRRAANGVIRILVEQGYHLSLSTLLQKLAPSYKTFDLGTLQEFFYERLQNLSKANPSVVSAVLASGNDDLVALYHRIAIVQEMTQEAGFRERFSTFKRVANIIKDLDLSAKITVEPALFEQPEERKLHERFLQVSRAEEEQRLLEGLFGLKPELDAFFDAVMVNADDEKVRTNRQHLVASVYLAFKEVADIKEISL